MLRILGPNDKLIVAVGHITLPIHISVYGMVLFVRVPTDKSRWATMWKSCLDSEIYAFAGGQSAVYLADPIGNTYGRSEFRSVNTRWVNYARNLGFYRIYMYIHLKL